MAEPLATGSTEDADGYLQQLIVSLKDESPDTDPNCPTESAADYVARMVSAANEPQQTSEYVLAPEASHDPAYVELTGSDTAPFVASETDTISWRDLQAGTLDGDSQECDEPELSHAADDCVDVVDTPASPISSFASTPAADITEAPPKPEPPAEIPVAKRESISLIPRPTGDASAIARMREVANLITTDALNAYRSKQLITNAYVAFACAIVSIAVAQFASLFGVDHAGFARLVSHASLVAGGTATVVYLAMLIGIKRNEVAQTKVVQSPTTTS